MSELRPKRRAGFAGPLALLLALTASPGSLRADSDPTRPPDVPAAVLAGATDGATSDLALSAIFFAEGRRVAIIDDRRVREGDTIAGARISEIAKGHVRLERGGEPFTLRLAPHDVKRDHDATRDGEVWMGPAPAWAPAAPAITDTRRDDTSPRSDDGDDGDLAARADHDVPLPHARGSSESAEKEVTR